jgi:hypothetical protein
MIILFSLAPANANLYELYDGGKLVAYTNYYNFALFFLALGKDRQALLVSNFETH